MKNKILKISALKDLNEGTYYGEWSADRKGRKIKSISPIDNTVLGEVFISSRSEYEKAVKKSEDVFLKWRELPAPKRGEVIRQIVDVIRKRKKELAEIITLEVGKISEEALGEVQEVIDVGDMCLGMARQLYGNSMHSERPFHRLYEQWHPLGPVGIITAFNFPFAVWAWNAFVAAVCGNSVIWKPSEKAPLIAVAVTKICHEITKKHGFEGLFSLVTGGRELGAKLSTDKRIPLISATGSTAMGRDVGEKVAARFGRSILELGGNNGVIVLKDADLDLAAKAIFFAAVGTAGQRCTTTRRVIVEREVKNILIEKLISLYKSARIGNPLEKGVLVGPLIDKNAVKEFEKAIKEIKAGGGEIVFGGSRLKGNYVVPAICLADETLPIIKRETFGPLVYVIECNSLEEAIRIHNNVPQGLSSSIFTSDLQRAEEFLSVKGSDCGIANVNIGTSGAEVGGAFGGEKETGGGRETGSDSWKAYMRRQTVTVNWGKTLTLAQNVKFGE